MILVDPHLEQTFASIRETDKRTAAEIAYALGVIYKRSGRYDQMIRYREESVRLFRELNIRTIEDACPRYDRINEVWMPDLIHEGVVARNLDG
jgi:hypothetical protein